MDAKATTKYLDIRFEMRGSLLTIRGLYQA